MPAFDEIVDECVYAVACCYDHYCDEGLSEEGIAVLKEALLKALPKQDSGIAYRECMEGQRFQDRIDFPPGVMRPEED